MVVVPQAGAVDEWPEGILEAELQIAAFWMILTIVLGVYRINIISTFQIISIDDTILPY
ncbi:MAG: hypothetical protein ACFFFH_10855 [Candidatus Thorarchaeota archaeon]